MKNKLKISSYFIKLSIVFLILSFLLGCGGITPSKPIINTFTATPPTIASGESSTLSWTVTDATSVTIDQGIGSVAVSSGTSSVTPGATTTYTLTATNSAGSVTATTTVTVRSAEVTSKPIINGFVALQPTITSGQPSTLGWSVTGATSVTIDQGIGEVPATGTYSVTPSTTTTYKLTATNSAGSVTATATVTVSSTGATSKPIINSFTATPLMISSGESSTLRWSVTGATSVTIQGIGPVEESSGERLVRPTTTTTYKLTAINSAGSVDETAKVRVGETKIIQPDPYKGKDAYVEEVFPTVNTGNFDTLFVGKVTTLPPPGLTRAYLQFDLSSYIPADAVITEAKLKLYQSLYSGSGGFSIGIYRVKGIWYESSITWSHQPNIVEEGFGSITVNSSSTGTWRNLNIRNWVQSWVDGSFENNGILLKAINETTIGALCVFYSSDYTADTSKRPKLEIKYYRP